MSGVGITYLWTKKEFPTFVRLEGRRGDYEVYPRVVRCRDCVHLVYSELLGGDACNLQDDINEYHWLNVEPDGFCKWGERRSE